MPPLDSGAVETIILLFGRWQEKVTCLTAFCQQLILMEEGQWYVTVFLKGWARLLISCEGKS